MKASWNGHLDIVRTLLDGEANLNAQNNVRNQMVMMMIIIILLTILIMMMMMIVVINDVDGDDCI